MKKIKKLLPVLLMSIMSVSAFAEKALIDGIKYDLSTETLNAEVIRNSDNPYSGDITIPESVDYKDKTYSVTSIGREAFFDCSGLTSVTIPNSVTSIGESAFDCCTGLTSVTIGNSVTSIGRFAFYDCSGLTSVTIPNSVTSIGRFAFSYCSGLTSITIPNSVTNIGDYAFSGCSALESIIVEEGNTIYDSRENCNAIIETETNTLLRGCNNTIIPSSVTTIGSTALYGCSGLTSIIIPNSVTSIGDYAFSGCKGLTSITIPNSVTSIGEYAFDCCTGLTSVTIGNSVTSIGKWAFSNCKGLTSITIPNSVTNIGDFAFHGCPDLTSVISLIEEPFEINENTFYNWVEDHDEFTTATLYVPAETKAKYESTPAWNKFKMIVEQEVNAVESVETDAQAEETVRYNVGGQRISSPQKGLNIVKMSDGTTRKIMCK